MPRYNVTELRVVIDFDAGEAYVTDQYGDCYAGIRFDNPTQIRSLPIGIFEDALAKAKHAQSVEKSSEKSAERIATRGHGGP